MGPRTKDEVMRFKNRQAIYPTNNEGLSSQTNSKVDKNSEKY